MSSILRGRLWSYPLFVLAVLLSLIGFVPAAQADTLTSQNQDLALHYDCLTGQTVVLTPGQYRVKLVDGSGNTVGYDQIISAGFYIFPVAQFSSQGERSQVEWDPGTQTSFTQETGLPVNADKTVWLKTAVQWTTEGGIPEYDTSQVACAGQPTDTDGDGVPDDLDKCPALAVSGTPDGCPPKPVVNVSDIQSGHAGAPGSVTVSVMNPVDNGGAAESYDVNVGGNTFTTPSLADGATSTPVTLDVATGNQTACATSKLSGDTTCAPFTVPSDGVAANSGSVVFTVTCTGMPWNVTNNGWKTSNYTVYVTAPGQSNIQYDFALAPGASHSGTTPSYWYGLTVKVVMHDEFNADVPNPDVGSRTWAQPAGCNPPMSGGDQLVKWGSVTRLRATPRVTITTKAYYAHYGYQVKGKGIVWFAAAHPGTHSFKVTNLRVPRHNKRVVRYWVVYQGADVGIGWGQHAFTGWHTYKRP